MVDNFTEGARDPADDGRWVAMDEVGAILRAILLAAVALAIGALVASQVDGPAFQPVAAPSATR